MFSGDEDPFGKKVNYAVKLALRAEDLINQFWDFFNSEELTPAEKRSGITEIVDQIQTCPADDQDKFRDSQNPERRGQTIFSCLRLLGIRWAEEKKEAAKSSAGIKASNSDGSLFNFDDEDSGEQIPRSPRMALGPK